MNNMLWQLEIYAKSIVEHINEDTQCKICGCTQSLKLKACFHIEIKSVFRKLFFYQVHAKISDFIWFFLEKSFMVFHSQMFSKETLLLCSNPKISFKHTGCWLFPKHVMFTKKFLFKSQKKVIIYNYTNRKSKHT